MTCLLDTSVVVRYLTDDPPHLGAAAAAIIDTEEPLMITESALAEIGHVLRRVYGIERANTIDLLVDFVRRRNIEVKNLDKSVVMTALAFCRPSGRVSLPDALIWASARTGPGETAIYTFDRRFPSDCVELRMLGTP